MAKTSKKPKTSKRAAAKPRAGSTPRSRTKIASKKEVKGLLTSPKRVQAVLAGLDVAYPAATCELRHDDAFQLLISTILSAQCTDERVNQVTRTLFPKYPGPQDFAYADPKELEEEIRPTGFFRNKTKSVMGASKKLVEEFGGAVPQTMEEMLTLPGVARKTANVVLGTAYGIVSGIVVDTHVLRLSWRLGLTRNTDPKKVEQDLMSIIPKEKWILFSHQLIWHGRRVCQARKPKCAECNLVKICESEDKTV